MSADSTTTTRSVLLYSDDAPVRAQVRQALGSHVGDIDLEWHEVATYDALVERVIPGRFDLLILDGEARKAGGMGVARELKNQVYNCPRFLSSPDGRRMLGSRPGRWQMQLSHAHLTR